ncbi:MAG: phytanoyl-CoA dioxygenase family protein [Janthinobacterium lividum]
MPAATKKEQIAELMDQGFVVARGLASAALCANLRELGERELLNPQAPLEYEADLRYPGAPASRAEPGGRTVRRLLDAYARDPAYAQWATSRDIRSWMETYFGQSVALSRAHHNCLMTKHPTYGSLTGWHRDARYWSFERDDLVSAWLALGPETVENGALWLVPGSHRIAFDAERFDADKFFRADMPANQALISRAVSPALQAGDVVFFHCNTLHSAGQNLTEQIKYSLVFTYHGLSNAPQPGTRSTSKPEVLL